MHTVECCVGQYRHYIVPWVVKPAGICEAVAVGCGVVIFAVWLGACVGESEVCYLVCWFGLVEFRLGGFGGFACACCEGWTGGGLYRGRSWGLRHL